MKTAYWAQCQMLLDEGRNFLKLKRREEAYIAFKNAVLFGSNHYNAWTTDGKLLFDEGRSLFELKLYQEALEAFEIAILLQRRVPDNAKALGETLIAKGEVLFKLKRYQEILDVYTLVRDAYKQDRQAYNMKSAALIKNARWLYNTGCYLQSYAAYKRAILFDPHSDYVADYYEKSRKLLIKSLDLYEKGEYEKACFAYEDALQFNPDNEKLTLIREGSLDKLILLWQSKKIQAPDTETREGEVAELNLVKLMAREYKSEKEQLTSAVGKKKKEDEKIDFAKLMVEGYECVSKRSAPDIDDVSDADEYDAHYNQYYERDLDAEAEDYAESEEGY